MLIPFIVFGISLAIFLFLQGMLFHKFHRWAKQSQTTRNSAIIQHVRTSSLLVCIIIPIYFFTWYSGLPQERIVKFLPILSVLFIICFSFILTGILGIFFQCYMEKMSLQISAARIIPSTIKAVIFIFAGFMILQTIGIKIGPAIAGVGIFGTGVLFILRDALANLAAGFYVLIDKPIKIGNYIKIDSGEEGYVLDIDWRATRIKTLENNILIVPNSKLITASITNFHLLDTKMSITIPILVKYNVDPEMVERVLLEILNDAKNNICGICKMDEPVVRLKNFGEFGLEFIMNCSIEEHNEQWRINHELRKLILVGFRRKGIEIVHKG